MCHLKDPKHTTPPVNITDNVSRMFHCCDSGQTVFTLFLSVSLCLNCLEFFFTLIYGLTQLLPPACSWNLPVLLLLFNYSQTCKCCCNIKPIAVFIFWSRSARKKGFARFHFTALWRLLAMTWIHTCFINSHKSLMLIGRPGLEIVTEFTHLWFLWTLATT